VAGKISARMNDGQPIGIVRKASLKSVNAKSAAMVMKQALDNDDDDDCASEESFSEDRFVIIIVVIIVVVVVIVIVIVFIVWRLRLLEV
jgi:heme/copper-type cytochrome/quinol oxidase subunit 2